MLKQISIALFMMLFLLAARAEPIPQVFEDGAPLIDVLTLYSGESLDQYLEFYEDVDHSAQIDDLSKEHWQRLDHGSLAFGYTDSVYWFRMVFTNPTALKVDRLMSISYPVLDYIEVHRRQSGSEWTVDTLGDKQRFYDRIIPHRYFVLPMSLNAGETQEWIFRVDTSSSMQFPVSLWEERDFFVHDQNQILGLGLYYGIMLIMVLYNLFVFFSVREVNYLYYVLYVASMTGFLGSLQGVNFQYLWPEATEWNDQSIIVMLAGVVIFAGIFTRNFLFLKEGAVWFDRILLTLVLACVGIVLMSNFFPYHLMIRVLIVTAVIAISCALYVGILRWGQGFSAARYYTIAWSSMLFGGVVLAMNKFNLLPRNFFTENAIQIGSAMEVILLSFALADRLNQEKRDRYEAQISALEHEKLARRAQGEALEQERNARHAQEKALEHERAAREAQASALEIQRRATETLEVRVKERTLELESVNRRLQLMSTTDALTNVRNRRYFDQVMEREFARAIRENEPLSVVMLDIDHFKRVNDDFGHQAGDEILRSVAQAIRQTVNRDTDLIARYGGEEFVVILPNTENTRARELAETIRICIENLDFDRIGANLRVTISIGIHGGTPSRSDTQDEWVKLADEALYYSKANGRNRITVYQ
ncbi:sensor domain-containing diguanylate cyclase [Thalassolituus oleivorans]|uniref:sensor domain-containing diguanylate cyclase n=1 Tax=Thalassolituus oleivorans TaxID=187493 RepID=UPI0023F07884|nr:7TM diverse intracellular signaling domain-containing protein [Thalassolituus oleivorans]